MVVRPSSSTPKRPEAMTLSSVTRTQVGTAKAVRRFMSVDMNMMSILLSVIFLSKAYGVEDSARLQQAALLIQTKMCSKIF